MTVEKLHQFEHRLGLVQARPTREPMASRNPLVRQRVFDVALVDDDELSLS